MDAPPPSLSEAAGALAQLSAGERAWFWLCPAAPEGASALLVQPLRQDPDMRRLQAQIARIPLPPGATQCLGMASVGEDGALRLSSPAASAPLLEQLAGWALRHVGAHPALSRLRNASLLDVSNGGKVRGIYQDDALWAGMAAPAVPGTIAQAAAALEALKPGDSAWFWMTDAGPGGQPFAALTARSADASGAGLGALVASIRRRSEEEGAAVGGIASVDAAGALTLTTQDDPDGWRDTIRSLVAAHGEAHPALRRLREARLLRVKGKRVVPVYLPAPAAPPVDLAAQSSILADLTEEDKLWFWFTDASAGGAPLLLLARDKDELKPQVKAASGAGAAARGQARLSGKGWVEFRTGDPFPGFVAALARWVADNRAGWPALDRLRGARMLRKDGEGNIVERQQDDAAWK